ncbi:flavin-dependent oxidoreductase [Roseibacterium sp. SDUM158017]|uniref:flavin-dependent oxidoreductase n=1 Tax=Roseicyclus salinarum TaxID=3036773 RepID=UPI00241590CC|nr:flavin-dependent oxidoreductase [Roseibacterium sp. SDUM158017]MDG4648908.1 flavin-dependent oxidoreductase [Roseibacterium sp. SDUM158017]
MSNAEVLIAGGGIAGLTLALTLHQIGVPCRVFESAPEVKPLGVGINLQPNAVRELFELGIGPEALDAVGLPAREWALVGLNGNDIHAEPRGREAGYGWPQYAVHRGAFTMALYRAVIERLGAGAVVTGARVTSYEQDARGVMARIALDGGASTNVRGALLIGADGIRSLLRARMHPEGGGIQWGGALMWRGTVRATPIRTGSSFVGLGTSRQRMVIYPISRPGADGRALVNWIAEVTVDGTGGWAGDRWFAPARISDFVHHFEAFRYPWLDVPEMLRAADAAFVNPMIDRDPVPTWVEGRVALMGDAAHAMYPTGSNGASQAIVDARVIGAKMLAHGVTPEALAAYDAELCGPVSELVLRNRGAGPFGLLDMVDVRCGGVFDDIDTVIPPAERAEFLAGYKAAAGFSVERLNAAPPTIPPGARIGAAGLPPNVA